MLLRTLDHLSWEGVTSGRGRQAIDIGCGAGTDTLELLRRGWSVLALDPQASAIRMLQERTPRAWRSRLTAIVAGVEEVDLPPADLIYASFSLPFCPPEVFPGVWRSVRSALRPGGHFTGELFGNEDAWAGRRWMTFHTVEEARALTRGLRVEMFQQTVEEGQSYEGPKHWHLYDLILEKPGARRRG